nr:MAG TPA: hypothetical protein [Bacteriophage sp.]
MYTDIFKYVQGNEKTIKRMQRRSEFLEAHRIRARHKDDDFRNYRVSERYEMAMFDESIDKREKYRRKYYRKPVESVIS